MILRLTVALFIVIKRLLAEKRYEMIGRVHTACGEVESRSGQTMMIWAALGGIIRPSRGQDIDAACGQLAAKDLRGRPAVPTI